MNPFVLWKQQFLLLSVIGVSNIGAWIYLIALNLLVFNMTQSPLAVAGLYIVKPLAALLTNGWAGSVVDRTNKRNLMIILNLVRAAFIMMIPFASSLWVIYALVLIINMAGSMFEPASFSYITKLLPAEQRQRFNAFRSLIDSGAFLLGPAIAGLLFIIGTPIVSIYLNAAALVISALLMLKLPAIEYFEPTKSSGTPLSWTVIRKDWAEVMQFSRQSNEVMFTFFLFNCLMVMATAIDSQEASFAKSVLLLSDSEYGFLVSIAGAGIIVGATVNALLVKRLQPSFLMGGGSVMVAAGYIIYAFSSSFHVAAIGFFVLAFALAFANTGFQTFSQNNIPIEKMGRVVSVFGLLEALLIIGATVVIGAASQLVSIQATLVAATFTMLSISILLMVFSMGIGKLILPLRKAGN